MAFIGLKVPAHHADLLASIPVPAGDAMPTQEMHVTLFFLGQGVPANVSLGAALACATVASRRKPFKVHAGLLTTFAGSPDEGVPVIVRVASAELMEFREELKRALDKMSIPYSNRHPEYKPHVTLAYTKGERVGPEKVGPISWDVGNIVVWSGEEMYDSMFTVVPLTG